MCTFGEAHMEFSCMHKVIYSVVMPDFIHTIDREIFNSDILLAFSCLLQ